LGHANAFAGKSRLQSIPYPTFSLLFQKWVHEFPQFAVFRALFTLFFPIRAGFSRPGSSF